MSVNRDRDRDSKGFNVKSHSKRELWSECSRIGFERWVSTFFVKVGGRTNDLGVQGERGWAAWGN